MSASCEFYRGAEIATPDIARLDNAAPDQTLVSKH